MSLAARIVLGSLTFAVEGLGRVGKRGAWWAGRIRGSIDQLHDAFDVAAMPFELSTVTWRQAARWAWMGLRGYDVRPFIRARDLNRSVQAEVWGGSEARLRAFFERSREGKA